MKMTSVLRVADLGLRPYAPTLALQESLVERRRRGEIADTLLLVEHLPVYTLGRRAIEAHVLASADELRKMGIEVIRTTRGGEVTYHGPGQLVGYPILDLGAQGRGVAAYVDALEDVIIAALAGFGVAGGKDRRRRGVWVGGEKIAALGVRVSRGISLHGFALNVSTDLTPYRWIVPCGMRDRGVTSLRALGPSAAMDSVKAAIVDAFMMVFGYGGWERADETGLAQS